MQRACADHLRGVGIPPDLVGRIGAFAAYCDLDGEDARQGIAESAIVALAGEYGLVVGLVDPIVVEVVEDIARDSGDAAGAASCITRPASSSPSLSPSSPATADRYT